MSLIKPRLLVSLSAALLFSVFTLAGTAQAQTQAAAPQAADDSYLVINPSSRFAAAKGLLVNDTAPAGTTLTAVLVGAPARGKLTLKPSGEFTYAPAAGYYGPDSFTYKAVAGGVESNVATVKLTVQYAVKSVLSVPVNATVPSPGAREYVRVSGTIRYTGTTTWNYRGTYPIWYYTRHEWISGTAVGVDSGASYAVALDSAKHDEPLPSVPQYWYRLRPLSLTHPVTGGVTSLRIVHKLRVNADGTTTAPPLSDTNFIVNHEALPRRAYVTNPAADTVTVVATDVKKIAATVRVGGGPDDIALTPTSTFAYVANSGSDTVTVIQVKGNAVAATVPVGDEPRRLAVNALGTRVYVANRGSDSVSVIDTATNTVVDTIDAADGAPFSAPSGLAVNHLGTRLYVVNAGSNSISVIDTATNFVVATIGLPAAPGEIAVRPDGSRLAVALPALGSVAVISAADNSLLSLVPVGLNPSGLAFRSLGDLLYVANAGSNSVSVIDAETNAVSATVVNGVGLSPAGVDISADGLGAFVVNTGAGTLQQVKISNTHVMRLSNTIVATSPAGPSPSRVALFF
jgi:YVTN family beta-propeller protein